MVFGDRPKRSGERPDAVASDAGARCVTPAPNAIAARGAAVPGGAAAADALGPGGGSPVVEFLLGDVVRLRRTHPCGAREWRVDRLGADIGLRCSGCGHHVLMDRRSLERRLVAFVERGDRAMSEAAAPQARDSEARS